MTLQNNRKFDEDDRTAVNKERLIELFEECHSCMIQVKRSIKTNLYEKMLGEMYMQRRFRKNIKMKRNSLKVSVFMT